ncbi:MAG: SDR family NAD(P)-dependent oxidoreductase [Candidatus Hatepunaea meridiana]|nr:SDR family NAD(P)-dependent oxidoreductase [Candidatus Hatepunaea meridiana]
MKVSNKVKQPIKNQGLVFIFPGLAPQWAKMGMELYKTEPLYREVLEDFDNRFAKYSGWSVIDEIKREEADSKLAEGKYGWTCTVAVQISLLELLKHRGFKPDAVVGHSGGEIVAAYAARVIDMDDVFKLVFGYQHLITSIEGQGILAHIAAEAPVVSELIEKGNFDAAIIGDNSPKSTLIAGIEKDIQKITGIFTEREVFNRIINSEVPFHTRFVAPHQELLYEYFEGIKPKETDIDIYSMVYGKKKEAFSMSRYYWVTAPRETVLFHQAVRSAILDGYRNFVEISPHPILLFFIEETLESIKTTDYKVVPCLIRENNDVDCFEECVTDLQNIKDAKIEKKVPVKTVAVTTPKSITDYSSDITDKEDHHEPIAVIGLSCRFPGGGNSPEEFWKFLMDYGDSNIEVPLERWDMSKYYSPNPEEPGKSITNAAHFLKGIDVHKFDAAFFSITPKEALSLDPMQKWLLEVAWEAMENAAIPPSDLMGENVGVFLGQSGDDNKGRHLETADLMNIDNYTASGSLLSSAGGRMSYVYGFTGPNISVDTACSSALVALHLSINALRNRECDMAFTAGANAIFRPNGFVAFSKLGAMSPDGKCKTFDESADGFGRGEGCGVVILKRLSDALRDKDNIRAVIEGSALNQDGDSPSFTSPSESAQEEIVRKALRNAGLKPSDIDYVEAHGTGTSVGDVFELNGLNNVFCGGNGRGEKLTVGSVKSNIGHLEGSAAMPSIIKVILSLKNETIPPNIHFNNPNPGFNWDEGCIQVPTKAKPWRRGERKRYAGVSAYGFSGTNGNVVFGEAPVVTYEENSVDRPLHLLTISAREAKALEQLTSKYVQYLENNPSVNIGDFCYTAGSGRDHFNHRLCVSGQTIDDFKKHLNEFQEKGSSRQILTGKSKSKKSPLVFLYSGQGSQYSGMTQQLYDTYKPFRDSLDKVDRIIQPYLDISLVELFFDSSQKELINRTDITQPAIFAVQCALTELWKFWGIVPDAVAGHSIGEYAAAVTAGIMTLEDAARLVVARGRLMHSAPGDGAMGVVFADIKDVEKCVEPYLDRISIAAVNAPNTVTISGENSTVEEILNNYKEKGVKVRQLTVSHAFHSPLMDSILDEFREVAEDVEYSLPTIQFMSCLTGKEEEEKFASAEYWTDHIRQPVLFQAGFQALESAGYKHFLEIGADTTLSGLGKRCTESLETVILPSLRKKDPNWLTLLKTLGTLYTAGFNPDWRKFDAPYSRRKLELPTYAFQGKTYWMDFMPKQKDTGVSSVIGSSKKFLGVELSSPALENTRIFQNRFSGKTHQFIRDHVIADYMIFPGAGMLSLIYSAIKDTYGLTSGVFKNTGFLNMMRFNDDEDVRDTQVILKKNHNDIDMQFISKNPAIHQEWSVNLEGHFQLDDSSEAAEPFELLEIDPNMTLEPFDPSKMYDMLRTIDSNFGPSFRLIDDFNLSPDLSRSRVVLGDKLNDGVEYDFYPGVIDGVIVSMFLFDMIIQPEVFEMFVRDRKVVVPYAIETFRFYREATQEVVCVSRSKLEGDSLFADADIFTPDGELIFQIRGLYGRVIETSFIQKPDLTEVANYLHKVAWIETPYEESEEIRTEQQWMLVNHGINQLSEKIKLSLEQDKHQVTLIESNEIQDRLTSGKFDGIAYLAATPDSEDNGEIPNQVDNLLHDALGFAQALIAAGYQDQVYFVTQGVHSLHPETEEPNLIEAPLWGFGLTLEKEFPELNCICIDVSRSLDDSEVQQLCKDLADPGVHDQIAIRGSQRSVAKFANIEPEDKKSLKSPAMLEQDLFQEDASYMITGGTGGLGLTLVDWMVEKGAGKIILTDIKNEDDIDLDLKELAKGEKTEIIYIRCNVSDEGEVKDLFEQIKSVNPPLKGVFHLAGVVDDGVIQEQTMEKFRRVLAPKANGAFYLHQATEAMDLDYFVMFSSIASVMGSPGQANYSSANRFLDSLAEYRRQKELPAISVNWGPWKDVGMAVVSDKRGKRIEEMGVSSLSAYASTTVLEKILMDNLNGVTVTSINWQKYIQILNEKEKQGFYSNFQQIIQESDHQEKEAKSDYRLKEILVDTLPKLRHSVLTENVIQIASDVIGYADEDGLEDDQPLTDQGFDSLSAVELRNQLGQAIGTSLPVSLLFDYPTVQKITDFLLNDVLKFEDSPEEPDMVSETEILDNIEQLIKGQ